VLSWVLY
jgi:hypothetical protein